MSKQILTPLEQEIANIETRQSQTRSNFVDSYIYPKALEIAKARLKFEKDHPHSDFCQSFMFGLTTESLTIFQFGNGKWSCYSAGNPVYKLYMETDTSLVELLHKFLHTN